jgi:hypothetical protein
MKSKDFLKEGFVEDAASSHKDHEVQMARKDCYYAAEHALAIHKLLKHVSETQGIEGWVASKITLASDYLNTVREYLEYEMMSTPEPEGMSADVNVRLPIAEGRVKQLMMDLEELKPAEFKKKYNKTKEEVKKELAPGSKTSQDSNQSVDEGLGDNPAIGVDQITGKEKLRPHTGVGPKPGTIKHKLGKMAHTAKATMDYARGKPDRMGHLEEMTTSSVSTVNNPESKKPKSQVGSLFGGSYGEQKTSKNKKVIKR